MARYSIPYVQVNKQYAEEQAELDAIIRDTLANQSWVGDKLIEALEEELADFCGVKHVVALNSGTDALIFGMLALGIGKGDEVITPPNSFVASTAAIVHVGATPVFADVLPDQNIDPTTIETKITPRTKAIMPVHLTGRVCRMDAIEAIARKHKLQIIEDSAQSIGSKYQNRMSGSFGAVGCFSAHPLKNLNACGDSGFATTNDASLAKQIKLLRSHGMTDRATVEHWGYVSRMDTLQAAILRFRLKHLPSVIKRRRENAQYYQERLSRLDMFVPPCLPEEFNTFHTFVVQVRERDVLQEHLKSLGIKTAIHYPIPIHMQPAAKSLGHKRGDFPVTEAQAEKILTLPVNQFMAKADLEAVAAEIENFLTKN